LHCKLQTHPLVREGALTQHTEKLKTFISIHNIDVMIISETHFNEKSYLKFPNYAVYHTNHPAGLLEVELP
jgi:hypothetical protein